MGLDSAFNVCLHVPALNPGETTRAHQLGAFAPDVLPRATRRSRRLRFADPHQTIIHALRDGASRSGRPRRFHGRRILRSREPDRWVECLRDLSANSVTDAVGMLSGATTKASENDDENDDDLPARWKSPYNSRYTITNKRYRITPSPSPARPSRRALPAHFRRCP